RGDAGGECRVQPIDAADAGPYHHCLESLSHVVPLGRGGCAMKRILLALLVSLLAAPALGKDEFHLYNWNNYIAPETIKRFEEFCKCEVVQTYYSDNEELLAKLAAGARGYDILVPTSNAVQALIKGKQLKPIDKSQLPNLKNINPIYLNTVFDP